MTSYSEHAYACLFEYHPQYWQSFTVLQLNEMDTSLCFGKKQIKFDQLGPQL